MRIKVHAHGRQQHFHSSTLCAAHRNKLVEACARTFRVSRGLRSSNTAASQLGRRRRRELLNNTAPPAEQPTLARQPCTVSTDGTRVSGHRSSHRTSDVPCRIGSSIRAEPVLQGGIVAYHAYVLVMKPTPMGGGPAVTSNGLWHPGALHSVPKSDQAFNRLG